MKILFITQLLLFSFISCEKEENNNYFPVSLELKLLDSLGNSSTQFSFEETIIFVFNMANHSDSTLYFETNFINEDFFKVYEKIDGEKISVGKPYRGVFCEFRAMEELYIPPHEIRGFAIPWIPDSEYCCPPFCNIVHNLPLERGDYVTSFSSKFKFHTKNHTKVYKTDVENFKVNFKIE